jgi:hypothetical protein
MPEGGKSGHFKTHPQLAYMIEKKEDSNSFTTGVWFGAKVGYYRVIGGCIGGPSPAQATARADTNP